MKMRFIMISHNQSRTTRFVQQAARPYSVHDFLILQCISHIIFKKVRPKLHFTVSLPLTYETYSAAQTNTHNITRMGLFKKSTF